MEDYVGSVIYSDRELATILDSRMSDASNVDSQASSFFANIRNLFTFKNSNKPVEPEPAKWEEFPWENIIVKTDIIKKWADVDMKKIRDLH